MFIPSMYKSAPQVINITAGNSDYAISAVNADYTRVTPAGFPTANDSGFTNQNYLVARIKTSTLLEIVAGAGAGANPFAGKVLVEEFLPLFFKRAFIRNSIAITDETLTGTYDTGIIFGASSRAYVLSMGWSASVTHPAVNIPASAVQVGFELDKTTGIVTMTRNFVTPGIVGTITGYFMVVEPK
jgi:hypothetical protein